MKKLNFTCPDCGGHQLIIEQPLQWIQYDILGFDDDGDLLLDKDKPSIVNDASDKYDIFCNDCEALFSLASIKETYMKYKAAF
jgi:hypothetical protein